MEKIDSLNQKETTLESSGEVEEDVEVPEDINNEFETSGQSPDPPIEITPNLVEVSSLNATTNQQGPIIEGKLPEKPPVIDILPQNSKTKITLLTYNIYLRPPLINKNANDYKNLRLKKFTEHLQDYDIINLQELFCRMNNRQATLIEEAEHQNLAYSAAPPVPPFFSKTPVDAGLLTLSKFKIIKQDFKSFEYTASIDKVVQKGVLYSKILIEPGTFLHLFNTQLQSSYSKTYCSDQHENYEARMNQVVVVRNVITYFLKKYSYLQQHGVRSFNDLIFVTGDFNVDARAGQLPNVAFNMQDGRAMEWVKEVQETEKFTEYNFLIEALSDFGNDGVVDHLFEASCGGGQVKNHPITYADSKRIEKPVTRQIVVDGVVTQEEILKRFLRPKERLFTPKKVLHSRMRLDYIFQILPEKEERFKVDVVRSCVKEFFQEGEAFTQLSSHYGVELTFEV